MAFCRQSTFTDRPSPTLPPLLRVLLHSLHPRQDFKPGDRVGLLQKGLDACLREVLLPRVDEERFELLAGAGAEVIQIDEGRLGEAFVAAAAPAFRTFDELARSRDLDRPQQERLVFRRE